MEELLHPSDQLGGLGVKKHLLCLSVVDNKYTDNASAAHPRAHFAHCANAFRGNPFPGAKLNSTKAKSLTFTISGEEHLPGVRVQCPGLRNAERSLCCTLRGTCWVIQRNSLWSFVTMTLYLSV